MKTLNFTPNLSNSDSQFCSNFLVCVSLRQKPNNFYLAWGWLSLLMLSGMRLIFGLEKTLHHDVGYSGAQEQLTSGNVARGRVLDLRKPKMPVSAIASDRSQAPSPRGAHTQMVSPLPVLSSVACSRLAQCRCSYCSRKLATISIRQGQVGACATDDGTANARKRADARNEPHSFLKIAERA
jgi:hypothetical protein